MTNISNPPGALGQAGGVANAATGSYTGDGTAGAINIALGFTPKYVRLMNLTAGLTYEYFEPLALANGDTAVPNEDTVLTTWSTGDVTIDKNSYIQTNMAFQTSTEMATAAPGSSGPGDGTTGTVSVTYEAPVQSSPPLSFVAGASGAGVNVNTDVYVWFAIG